MISYSDPPTGAYLAKSLNEAVAMVTGNGVLADKVEGVFIIGGSSVYEVMFFTYWISEFISEFLYPRKWVVEGIMLFDPSVSQSVSPVFLVSATPLKPLKRILWICCYKGHNAWMRISTGNFDSIFSLRVTPLIWPKWKILLKQIVSPTPLNGSTEFPETL